MQLTILITLHWPWELITGFSLSFPWWMVLCTCQLIILSRCQTTGSDPADTEMQTVLSLMVVSLGPIRIFMSRLRERSTFLFLQDFAWGEAYANMCVWTKLLESCVRYLHKDLRLQKSGLIFSIKWLGRSFLHLMMKCFCFSQKILSQSKHPG